MKSRHLHLWLGSAGALFLNPGLLWIAISGARLKVDDAYIALQPLVRIPLRRISDSNLRKRLIVPDTSQPGLNGRSRGKSLPAYFDKTTLSPGAQSAPFKTA
jgi:hypothetical protein